MRVVGIVPARSGSKGFSNKNMAIIRGQSLLERAVRKGVECEAIDDVYVSTDSGEYEEVARKAGAKSVGLRPAHLAGDTVKTIDVVIDLLPKLDRAYDIVVLLQPTGPVRTVAEIEFAIEMLREQTDLEAVVSVSRLFEPHPCKLKVISADGYLKPFLEDCKRELPRQILREVYWLTGSIYVIRARALVEQHTFFPNKTRPFIMNRAVNIDSEDDLILLDALIREGKISLE